LGDLIKPHDAEFIELALDNGPHTGDQLEIISRAFGTLKERRKCPALLSRRTHFLWVGSRRNHDRLGLLDTRRCVISSRRSRLALSDGFAAINLPALGFRPSRTFTH